MGRPMVAASVVAVLGLISLVDAQSSCLQYKDADSCRQQSEVETGDPCLWCACKAVPSECVGAGLAKHLPAAVFTCDPVTGTAERSEEPHLKLQQEPSLEGVLAQAPALFNSWRNKHGKFYGSQGEEQSRFETFEDTLAMTVKHNLQADSTYQLGLNKFADMTWLERQAFTLGVRSSQNCSATHTRGQFRMAAGAVVPEAVDWREKGAVSPVKNQGHCGSCWTFSTTGCLESHHYLTTGEMVLLSEQQLVDCAQAFDNHGCNGGLPSHAFEYVRYNGGLETEEAYPYQGVDSKCMFSTPVGATVQRSVNITFQDEAELKEALATAGPVSIAFEVMGDFHAYAGGVYNNPECGTGPEEVNHAVLAVGYGTDSVAGDYWIVKNSWGADWGLNGYFHIARGSNMCGLSDCASYPEV